MVVCLERGADLHMAQLMPLPLTVSCFSKIQIGFTVLTTAHPGSPGQRAVKRVCVLFLMRAVLFVRRVRGVLQPGDGGADAAAHCGRQAQGGAAEDDGLHHSSVEHTQSGPATQVWCVAHGRGAGRGSAPGQPAVSCLRHTTTPI